MCSQYSWACELAQVVFFLPAGIVAPFVSVLVPEVSSVLENLRGFAPAYCSAIRNHGHLNIGGELDPLHGFKIV